MGRTGIIKSNARGTLTTAVLLMGLILIATLIQVPTMVGAENPPEHKGSFSSPIVSENETIYNGDYLAVCTGANSYWFQLEIIDQNNTTGQVILIISSNNLTTFNNLTMSTWNSVLPNINGTYGKNFHSYYCYVDNLTDINDTFFNFQTSLGQLLNGPVKLILPQVTATKGTDFFPYVLPVLVMILIILLLFFNVSWMRKARRKENEVPVIHLQTIDQSQTCSNCGTFNSSKMSFCISCGARIIPINELGPGARYVEDKSRWGDERL